MSMEFIAIISVGVAMLGVGAALASLIITGQNSLRREMQEQRKEMQEQRKEMQEQGERHSNELTQVKVEVAALKATVETYFRVRVDPPMQSAVAESPEDYDAD